MSTAKIDSVFRTRSLGTATPGITDQYADGKAAKVWELYIGDANTRTVNYKRFIVDLLKKKGVKRVLDAACGTGVDSVMLLEEGFTVTSTDASDKMLKFAHKTRWERRKEEAFDNWIIEEANWLTLTEDLGEVEPFDAVINLGNSFAHLPDFRGDQSDHMRCFENFKDLVKPGGLFIIDHRNYDFILSNGHAPQKNIYYNSSHVQDIKTSILYVNKEPNLITLDYYMNVSEINADSNHFRLSYYPHRVEKFKSMLKEVFGEDSRHTLFADFQPVEEVEDPSFYIHVVEKN